MTITSRAMKNSPAELCEPLTDYTPLIKPADDFAETRPLIAITQHAILTETGDLYSRSDTQPRPELRRLFMDSPAALFVCDRALAVLGELNELFADSPRFQYEILALPKYAFNPEWTERGIKCFHENLVVNRVGFYADGYGDPGKWHLLLDCVDMSGGLPENMILANTRLDALMKWGQVMRRLVRDLNIKMRPTNGGLASQVLRSKRFYPRARRRIPTQTNENCRPGLRGNHYDFRADPAVTYTDVLEIDQQNAHHAAAASLVFPAADSLYARMSYRFSYRPAGRGLGHLERSFEHVLAGQHGQLLVELYIPGHAGRAFRPHYLHDYNGQPIRIYTNEIPYLRALGIEPRTILASWTGSAEPADEGVRAYADFCLALANEWSATDYRIVKRALLTLYGILGAQPKEVKRYHARADKAREQVELRAGHYTLNALASAPKECDPFTANLIQRGMIEAETTWRSLELANELTVAGHDVLAVYADALYIREVGGLPMLPPPWRIKNEMAHVRFPRVGVVIGQSRDGAPIQKVPGGIRREIHNEGASPDWLNHVA